MRKQLAFLSFLLLLLITFSSYAYSHYKAATTCDNKNVCCKEIETPNRETIFESLVKQFVGAVKM